MSKMTAKSATITVKLLNAEGLKVSLLHAAMAARTCTDTVDKATANDPVLKSCLNSGHLTIFESINYIFEWRGISRSLLQQISRHRHTSPCVESTRWTLHKDGKLKELWSGADLKIQSVIDNSAWELPHKGGDTYAERVKIDNAIYHARLSMAELFDQMQELLDLGAPVDVVKYFLPEATPTNEVICINARELRHIIELRTASRALGEFRELCDLVLGEISEALEGEHDFIFEGVKQ